MTGSTDPNGPVGPRGPRFPRGGVGGDSVGGSGGGSVFQTASGPTIPQAQVSSVSRTVTPVQQQVLPQQPGTQQQVAPQASNCLNKSYIQSGFVMFSDICTNEQAVNTTTTQVASNVSCLTKQNAPSGGVMFTDTCTGEWAQKN